MYILYMMCASIHTFVFINKPKKWQSKTKDGPKRGNVMLNRKSGQEQDKGQT